MKLASNPCISAFFSRAAPIGAMFVALGLSNVRAAELVMFEQAGCVWCEAFDRKIAPIYGKTEEGLRAPLRRVDTGLSLPPDLAFIERERLTPLFVLIDKGREIGRIRGYPGEDSFWGQLSVLVQKLDASGAGADRARLLKKNLLVDERSSVF
jgi:thioredoxin-related protein